MVQIVDAYRVKLSNVAESDDADPMSYKRKLSDRDGLYVDGLIRFGGEEGQIRVILAWNVCVSPPPHLPPLLSCVCLWYGV